MPPRVRKKDFVCYHENCEAAFYRKDRLESHLLVHDGERPFVCSFDDCFKSYTRKAHLKRHEDTHGSTDTDTFRRCKIEGCEALLKTKETLRKHMEVVHRGKKNKTYKCTICDASFNKHSWLKTHMYRHTGIRPHVCPVENCNKRFLVPNKLRKHMMVHDGYTCTETGCSRNFPTWSLYVKHFKVYHAVVHKCDICNKVFSTATNLKSHKALHNNEREVFICPKPYCTRFYFAKRNLNSHIRSYHDKRPFTCTNELCQKSFPTEALLTCHQRDHDPNKPMRKKRKKKRNFAAYLAGCIKREGRNSCLEQNRVESMSEESDDVNQTEIEDSDNANQTEIEESEDANQPEIENKSDSCKQQNSEEIEKYLDESVLSDSENTDKVLIVFNYKSMPKNAFDDADNELDVHSCSEDGIVREN